MCGIVALVCPPGTPNGTTAPLVAATRVVRHRGPDDEGFLLWSRGTPPAVYAGSETAAGSRDAHRLESLPRDAAWQVAFGHRRLSILDLSPAGFQPMRHEPTGLAVAYNGEIYNYVELRAELERLGHRFASTGDTEVLLAAWAEWGPGCLDRFNGMFAFVLLDPRGGGELHAVRDRFGIKPLYWARVGETLAFASEMKQVRALPGHTWRVRRESLYEYFATGRTDHTRETLEASIFRLLGGERAVVRLDDPELRVEVTRWYDAPSRAWRGSDGDAAAELRELLADSVRLCLRSDVPVGTCLSGGIDSSTIACLVQRELDARGRSDAQVTVTAAFDGHPTNEWPFAKLVVDATGARSIRVLPTAERFREELGRHLWHMDEPYDGMCQFTQWCVFGAVAGAGLKVALDGQGSDEHFAGYSGATDTAFLASLLRNMKLPSLVRESRALNGGRLSASSRALGLALRDAAPAIGRLYPKRFRAEAPAVDWVGFAAKLVSSPPPRDLADCLRRQVAVTSLPALLRYEDRNSMAASVEGRVPFLDHRITELVSSFPDRLKIDKGVKKVVLRESMQGIIPDAVLARRDKLGYATPELDWLRRGGGEWVDESITYALDAAPGVLDPDRARAAVMEVVDGRRPYTGEPWRILCYGFWLKEVVDTAWVAESRAQRGAAAWRHTS